MTARLESLFKLLDDDNQQSASLVMAELLKRQEEIKPVLRDIQEVDSPGMRRRVHQLESILTMRQRRCSMPSVLANREIDLVKRLMEVHTLWYDNDSDSVIESPWMELVAKADKFQPGTLERLGYFMRKQKFVACEHDDLNPNYYCVGIVLEELLGADFMLCAIAQHLAKSHGLRTCVARLVGDFVLVDASGGALLPRHDWRRVGKFKRERLQLWDSERILKLAVSMLFLCAVSSDSFRYVHTIGKCLRSMTGAKAEDMLPYPYTIKE